MGALTCYVVPLAVMLSFMIVDVTFIPGWLAASMRIYFLVIESHAFIV